jgi:Putative restriction endonuclease
MTVTAPARSPHAPPRRYLRPVEPLVFPAFDGEEMGETPRHLRLRTALWQAIELGFAGKLAVGSDQFVYYNGRDPKACCAPDVFVCLGKPQTPFPTWKTWEMGTPDLAIEIVSETDARDRAWDEKLFRYRELGVRELVRFAPDEARPLRIWDRVDDDLVERDPADALFSRCDVLDAYFCVRADATYGPWLYLARDPQGRDPYPSESEAREREAEARQRESEARQRESEARQRESEARERAEARVRELEAQLGKRG